MFSVEYLEGIVLISAFNIKKINYFTGEKLRKLILQSMKQNCSKIVLNLAEVGTVDAGVIENFKTLCEIAKNQGIQLSLANISFELKSQIGVTDYKNTLHICSLKEVKELAEIVG